MVWKILMVLIAIVIASIIIGGAIGARQVMTNSIPNFVNDNDNENSESSESGQGSSSPAVGGSVRIVQDAGDNSYSPDPIEVNVGETVTWVNEDDSSSHTVTSTDGIFNSDILERGQTFSHTFTEAGEYSYFCALHPNMVGTVIVS